jgi:hypothetical protein
MSQSFIIKDNLLMSVTFVYSTNPMPHNTLNKKKITLKSLAMNSEVLIAASIKN